MDSCIFVEYFDENSPRHNQIKYFFKRLGQTGKFAIASHHWALVEMTKVLTRKGFSEEKILKFTEKLLRKRRLDDNKIEWLPESPKKNYDFDDFFYDLQENLLEFKKHLADTIHITILMNHNIKYIATFNVEDFEGIDNLTVVDPRDIDNYL